MAATFYEKDMSALITEYNANISQAKNTNRRNGAVPSKAEYDFYVKAAEAARKISNMNVQQRAVYRQWSERASMNERKAMELLRILVPDYGKKLEAEKQHDTAPSSNTEITANSGGSASASVSSANNAASQESAKPVQAQAKTTASGFTTKNASEDVSAETIEKWYQEKPNHGFDDIVGMEDLKEIIKSEILDNIGWEGTDKLLRISNLKSFLFYGPFGTGKSFFIEAIAKELMDRGFKFIKLTGSDVHDSYVGVGEKKVKTAFLEAVDNAPCVIYFDEFENMCVRRDGNAEGHEKRLTVSFMESYNIIVNADKPVVFLAATNYPDKIESAMLSRILTYVLVPLPSEEVRCKYFNDFFKKTEIKCSDDINADIMADVTDNYSFRDLKKLTDGIKQSIKRAAKEQFAVYDENNKILSKESDENTSRAIIEGKLTLTKEMFENVKNSFSPEKKGDILASLEAFEKKI